MRFYLYTLFFLTVIFWITFGIFIFFINPYKADTTTFGVFFASLFLAILGTLTLLGFYFRLMFFKKGIILKHLKPAFRQGILLGLFFTGLLVFLMLNIFNWWTIALYFVILSLIELILRRR